ncbi:methyl-accepting chemotaxis protein [Ferrimonas balearica]|uniref:methyl-accepting chemotaxis protein n=1 Tax=Ferrimonas balearica TaxID=44012 RepID=UPI001C99994A|nr:methyl-accepting chemotaxis protein [Ferrimonas balearica]MBY5922397.1 methyl-accepting chemotaxis protein [Ferrimonas balearica]MBY5995381.1 methyl-accepting chemotaxis protein [Ferrimonas balearica]
MKITVAMRIIGGFTLVTLLLLILGGMSLLSIGTVSTHTQSFKSFSLPAKDGTGALERLLNAQQLALVNAYYSDGTGQLAQHTEILDALEQEWQQNRSQLLTVVDGKPELTEPLSQITQQHNLYWQQIKTLQSEREQALTQRANLSDALATLEEQVDDASSMLLDVMELEYSDNADDRALAGHASTLETSLIGLISIALELPKAEDLTLVDTLEGELSYLLSNLEYLQSNLTWTRPDGSDRIDPDLGADIDANLAAILSAFDEGHGVISQSKNRLIAQGNATQALEQARGLQSQLQAQIDRLHAQVIAISNAAGDEAQSALESSGNRTMVVMVLSILVASSIGAITIRAITRPLAQVNEALAVLARGDLTQNLSYRRDDEFGQLVNNTNRLVDSLRTLIQSIVDRANQLAAAAEETSAVTAQTTSGIQEQKSQVDQVASATTELSASATQVATGANDALGEIKLADDEAKQVKAISDANGATIQALANEVERASGVIHQLEENSAAIGGILDVIRGIAEQTNLLALNAAIEAARAGEQGRGFAVVADEVRSLASRTQQSTTEIQQMIEALQQGAKDAVAVMDQGQRQASESVAKTAEANQMLDAIAQAVDRVYAAGNQIAQAAQEQDQVAQTISARLEQIAGIAEETSSGAVQTATSSQQVAQLAEELQLQVREFKV